MCMNQTAKEKVTSFRLISLTYSTSEDASQDINYSKTRKAVKVSVEISRFAPLSNLYNYFQVFPYKNILSYTAVIRLIWVEEGRKGSVLAQKPCLLRIQQISGKTYWLRTRTGQPVIGYVHSNEGSVLLLQNTVFINHIIKNCNIFLHQAMLCFKFYFSCCVNLVNLKVLCSQWDNHSSEGAILVLVHFLVQIQTTF